MSNRTRRRRAKKKATSKPPPPQPLPSPTSNAEEVNEQDDEEDNEWEEASLRCRDHPEDARWKDDDGHLPIHVACYRRAPLSFVRGLHEAYADGISTVTNDGRLPIHLACDWSTVDVIEYLHSFHPDGARTRDKYGYIPMDFLWHNDRMSKRDRKRALTILASRPRPRTPPPPPTYPVAPSTAAKPLSAAGAKSTEISGDAESSTTVRSPTTTASLASGPTATSGEKNAFGNVAGDLEAESVVSDPELPGATEEAELADAAAGVVQASRAGAEEAAAVELADAKRSSRRVRGDAARAREDLAKIPAARRVAEPEELEEPADANKRAVAREDLAKVRAGRRRVAVKREESEEEQDGAVRMEKFCIRTAVSDHHARARRREVLYRERFVRDRDGLPRPFFESSTGRRSTQSVELALE